MKKKIADAQRYLQELGADGWLLYDFHRNNELAHLFLETSLQKHVTRRFFYWIPAKGEPVRLVHAIESDVLDAWPGEKRRFLSWQSLHEELRKILTGAKRIAMEYSPDNAIPYISKVDAGTVDLIRSFGIEVVSSGPFLLRFTSVLTPEQGHSHIRAGAALDRVAHETWEWIRERLRKEEPFGEYEVQQQMVRGFEKLGLETDSPPIVGVNAHGADPHYAPSKERSSPIRKGDFIQIDLWGKEKKPGSIYADIARVGVAASSATAKQKEIFSVVRRAQKEAIALVRSRFAEKKTLQGWEVDDAARNVVKKAGFGEFFIHRTGHNIDVNVHGSGTHMDNLEMHDIRPVLPSTCFSIEPGIYLPGEFGVRLESDVYVHPNGNVEIVGGEQNEIVFLV